ncbi:hypothetical protein ABT039_39835 [Streptomyces lasiicapitis]|uniref:hypothetical protein n=1 Tax=Streptomyces lasiicapitis TaxID=1923961 RepID=UPI003327CDFC
MSAAELDARAMDAYAAYMGHLYGCHPCQDGNDRDGDDCATGARLRAAWKTARNASLRARRAAAHPVTT